MSLFQKSAQKGGETKTLIYQLSWDTGKCNDDSKELLNIKSIPESPIYDLADIVTGKKVLSTLSDVEKYQDLTKHYCPTDKSSLFQKSIQEGGETKTLIYQLLWVQKIYLHDCSKELQGGLCKYCTAFYLMMMTLGNLVNL